MSTSSSDDASFTPPPRYFLACCLYDFSRAPLLHPDSSFSPVLYATSSCPNSGEQASNSSILVGLSRGRVKLDHSGQHGRNCAAPGSAVKKGDFCKLTNVCLEHSCGHKFDRDNDGKQASWRGQVGGRCQVGGRDQVGGKVRSETGD